MGKPAAKTSTAPTPKKPRKPREQPAMTANEKRLMMNAVYEADKDTPDAELAAQLGRLYGRTVQRATVTLWRESFGIKSVRKPTAAELLRQNVELKEKLAHLLAKIEPPVEGITQGSPFKPVQVGG